MRRFLAVSSFFVFILFIIWEANHASTNIFFKYAEAFPFKDKVGHFSLYGILAMLLDRAMQERNYPLRFILIPISIIWVLAFATIEEFTQIFIPNRNFDLLDLAADVFGVFFFVALSRMVEIRLKKVDFFSYKPTRKIQEDQE